MATTPSGAELLKKAHEMGAIINTERIARGLQPLYCVPYLMDCAYERAEEISYKWGHIRPNGDSYVTIIDYSIVSYQNIYENIAGGSDTAEATMQQFLNSPNHWAAIINPNITHMGIGVCYNPTGYAGVGWYWCQIFSNDIRGADYEYEGQYRPDLTDDLLDYGVISISCTFSPAESFQSVNVTIRAVAGTVTDWNDVKITRNGIDVNHTISSDKSSIHFQSGTSPTDVTKLTAGSYRVEFSKPNGYYSNDFLQTDDYFYTYFTMKNDGSEIPGITLNLTVRELTILKTDADTGEALSGAVLELWGDYDLSEIEVSQDFTLSDDGKTITFMSGDSPVVFTKIPSGTYVLYEYSAPDGYIKAEKAVFTVGDGYISLADGNKSGIIENNVLITADKKRIINLFPISYENSIRVFDLSEPQDGFTSNGLAVLRPTSCTSHKNSDIWDIDLVHPIDEWGKWKHLLPENVLKINGQLFRIDIMETECSENGAFVTVHARHISYDLGDLLIENEEFEGGNAQDFIDFCAAKSRIESEVDDCFYKEYEFAVTSDIKKVIEGDKYVNISYMAALIGADNCLVNRYGGEIYRDNFRISINERMENARDNAFFLQYGVNVSGIKQRIDYTDFCTLLDCADNFGNSFAISYTGEARWMFHHPRRRYYKLNYPDGNTGYNQIGNDGVKMWETVSSPKNTYKVTINQLKTDPRYEEFAEILNCDYGDCGTIYFPELDINTTQKIIGIDKDEILNEILNIELGNVVSSLVRPNFMADTVTSGHTLFDRLK